VDWSNSIAVGIFDIAAGSIVVTALVLYFASAGIAPETEVAREYAWPKELGDFDCTIVAEGDTDAFATPRESILIPGGHKKILPSIELTNAPFPGETETKRVSAKQIVMRDFIAQM
jgi:hypothetical protein